MIQGKMAEIRINKWTGMYSIWIDSILVNEGAIQYEALVRLKQTSIIVLAVLRESFSFLKGEPVYRLRLVVNDRDFCREYGKFVYRNSQVANRQEFEMVRTLALYMAKCLTTDSGLN